MKWILFWMYGSRAVLVGIYLIAPKTDLTFYAFSIGLGLTWLATVPPTAGLVGKLFGLRYLGTLFGLTLLSHQTGAFLRRLAGRAGAGGVRQLRLDVVRRHCAGRRGGAGEPADPRSASAAGRLVPERQSLRQLVQVDLHAAPLLGQESATASRNRGSAIQWAEHGAHRLEAAGQLVLALGAAFEVGRPARMA
jgi:hypothetical protein